MKSSICYSNWGYHFPGANHDRPPIRLRGRNCAFSFKVADAVGTLAVGGLLPSPCKKQPRSTKPWFFGWEFPHWDHAIGVFNIRLMGL